MDRWKGQRQPQSSLLDLSKIVIRVHLPKNGVLFFLCAFESQYCLMFNAKHKELHFLQEGYGRVSMLIASQKYDEAETIMHELIHRVEKARPFCLQPLEEEMYNRSLSECYLNLATCLFNREDCEQSFSKIKEHLDLAITLDNMNYWGYFNLSSYYYRTYDYQESLNNLNCSLSCLHLLKAVLSKDLQNRNKEIDLGRSIGYCDNNLKARYIRLLLQMKQNRWKMALNEVEALLVENRASEELQQLKELLLRVAMSTAGVQLSEVKALLNQAIVLISRIPFNKNRLESSRRSGYEKNALLKQIDDKIYEFNEVYRQVNDLGSSHQLFFYKVLHRTNKFDKKIHIVSNTIQQPIRQEKLTDSGPHKPSIELEAKVIERMNQSKKSLTESKNLGESIFDYTKSQNMGDSKNLIGTLLSSMKTTQKPEHVLMQQVQQANQQLYNQNMRRKMSIQVIQSQLRPSPEPDQILLSGCDFKLASYRPQQDDDLLLESMYDRQYQKTKKAVNDLMAGQQQCPQIKQQKGQQLYNSYVYPLSQTIKTYEVILLKAGFQKDLQEKFINVYAVIRYNREQFKFRSRQVNQFMESQLEWGESLGLLKFSEEPSTLKVVLLKSEPMLFNDRIIGIGEIELTSIGLIKIPLYESINNNEDRLGTKNIGTVSIRLIQSDQNLNSSFKKSVTSNYSESMKSQSQSSHSQKQ